MDNEVDSAKPGSSPRIT